MVSVTDKERLHRFIQLVGFGNTIVEATRAVEVDESTGTRWMRDPDVRKAVEEAKQAAEHQT
jgi:hypothetical protein